MSRFRLVFFVLALLALAGCVTDEEVIALNQVEHTPLEFDPTVPYDIGPWWSNGKQLLHLRRDGSYTLYTDDNRYAPPLERGSWGRNTYAELWLSPYDARNTTTRRVRVTKSGETIAIHVGSGAPMVSIPIPPIVDEDELIGTWTAPAGTLVLTAGLEYAFSPAVRLDGGGAVVTGHSGRWRLDDEDLLLIPFSATVNPYALHLSREASELVLQSDRTVFRQVSDAETRSTQFPSP